MARIVRWVPLAVLAAATGCGGRTDGPAGAPPCEPVACVAPAPAASGPGAGLQRWRFRSDPWELWGRAGTVAGGPATGPCTEDVDADGDGFVEERVEYTYGRGGRPRSADLDANADGRIDRRTTWVLDAAGDVVERLEEAGSGRVDWRLAARASFERGPDGRPGRTAEDGDGDGRVDETTTWAYDGQGRLVLRTEVTTQAELIRRWEAARRAAGEASKSRVTAPDPTAAGQAGTGTFPSWAGETRTVRIHWGPDGDVDRAEVELDRGSDGSVEERADDVDAGRREAAAARPRVLPLYPRFLGPRKAWWTRFGDVEEPDRVVYDLHGNPLLIEKGRKRYSWSYDCWQAL